MKFSKTPSYFSHLFSVIILREGELRRQEGQKLRSKQKKKIRKDVTKTTCLTCLFAAKDSFQAFAHHLQ